MFRIWVAKSTPLPAIWPNRYFGILFHCLQNGLTYDEAKAFPPRTAVAA